jgi:membrane-bound lytic murein transglycosylase B
MSTPAIQQQLDTEALAMREWVAVHTRRNGKRLMSLEQIAHLHEVDPAVLQAACRGVNPVVTMAQTQTQPKKGHRDEHPKKS